MARSAATKTTETATKAFKFQVEVDLPAITKGAQLDSELSDAIRASYDQGAVFSLDPIADTPPLVRKGVTTHDTRTAEQYIRRHAAALGLGVKVRVLDNGRVAFQGTDKKIVPTGADRKPRTKRTAA